VALPKAFQLSWKFEHLGKLASAEVMGSNPTEASDFEL